MTEKTRRIDMSDYELEVKCQQETGSRLRQEVQGQDKPKERTEGESISTTSVEKTTTTQRHQDDEKMKHDARRRKREE